MQSASSVFFRLKRKINDYNLSIPTSIMSNKEEGTMEKYNKRLFKILHFFLENEKRITGASIALSVGVSTRTVRNDIKELNQILEEYGAEITSEIGQGYKLVVADQGKFDALKKESQKEETSKPFQNIIPSDSEERVHYIISRLLLHSLNSGARIDFFDLEEELFVSTSTLKKDLRTIDGILKKHDLRISDTKKEGMRVVGQETKIRFCISEYIFNSQKITGDLENKFYKDIFSSEEVENLRVILMEAITDFNLRLTDIAFRNLLVHSLIMLKRFEKKRHVKYEENDIELFSGTKEFRCAQQIIHKIYRKLDISLGDEVYYLTQHLISSQRFLIENLDGDYEYKEEIEEILKTIRQGTGIDLSDDNQLINGLAMHLSAALQRLRFDMNIRNEFLDSIKNLYPLAFELAVVAGEVIEKKHKLKAKESEIGFLAMHFGAALERKGLNQKQKPKKVVLVCIAGIATALLLKEKLQHKFGQYIEIIKSCPVQEVDQELIDSADLVLTTVELKEFQSEKIKKINLFLNDEDLNYLSTVITDSGNQMKMIDYSSIFRKELFFTDMEFKDKQEILEFMTNAMVEKGYINGKIKKSIFKREEMATTELGSLVAIPHALFNDMEEAAVSVMVLKKPVIWENEKVQVILMLNIPQSKYDVWEIVFKNLYQFLIGNSGVAKLVKQPCYKQFIEDLLRQEEKLKEASRRI